MKLSDMLDPQHVIAHGQAENREAAIKQLLERLIASGSLPNDNQALKLILERERDYPTGIGGGVAIPHTNCVNIDEPLVAMGTFDPPVDFGAEDGPAWLVFLLLGSLSISSSHLKLLARISRLSRHGLAGRMQRLDQVDALLAAVRAEEEDFLDL